MEPTQGEIILWLFLEMGIPLILITLIIVVMVKCFSGMANDNLEFMCSKCNTKKHVKRSDLMWTFRAGRSKYLYCETCQKKTWHRPT